MNYTLWNHVLTVTIRASYSRAEGDGEVGQLVSRASEQCSARRLVVSVCV
jgi:hypothetical protein